MVAINEEKLKSLIRSVPDFPKKGIVFRDITTLLKDKVAFSETIDYCADLYKSVGVDKVVGVESRGFIFGSPLACRLGCGFVPVRKPNKLPAEKVRCEYQLEYGTDALEMHSDAIAKGEKVLIVDDVLATGGTSEATTKLVKMLGGEIIGLVFIIELAFLHGRDRLKGYDVHSLISYSAE
ncbi:MAG TPA: adenine phosphoribosyltransferase [Bacteroidota bacterium]|nr:adenine phosphoribosyltransferase [Bacteroidota bacterium]